VLVLLIEDDEDLGGSVELALSEEGYTVEWIRRGDLGLYRAAEWEADLVVLDRMLPGIDGFTVLKSLRKTKDTPVLMLTALNTLENRLEGLDAGADDYLGKPFELPELLSRVRALLRRSDSSSSKILEHDGLRIDLSTQRVWLMGEKIALTRSEFITLEVLLRKKGRPVSRKILEDYLYRDLDEFSPNALDVHIHRIRKKLGNQLIVTRRGIGYEIPDSL